MSLVKNEIELNDAIVALVKTSEEKLSRVNWLKKESAPNLPLKLSFLLLHTNKFLHFEFKNSSISIN